jgi:hypothetical protein
LSILLALLVLWALISLLGTLVFRAYARQLHQRIGIHLLLEWAIGLLSPIWLSVALLLLALCALFWQVGGAVQEYRRDYFGEYTWQPVEGPARVKCGAAVMGLALLSLIPIACIFWLF